MMTGCFTTPPPAFARRPADRRPWRRRRSPRSPARPPARAPGANGMCALFAPTRRTGAVEFVEELLLQPRRDLGAEAAERPGLVADDARDGSSAPSGRPSRCRAGRCVRRSMTSALDALVGELLAGLGAVHRLDRIGDDRHVPALAADGGLTERDLVIALRHLGLGRLDALVLEIDDRIVVGDRRDEEALGVVGVRGRDDLQSRDMGEERLEALRMLGGRRADRPVGAAEHEGHARPGRRTCSGAWPPG